MCFGFLDAQKKRFGVMLGDGEHHGIQGALQMLPLFTTARAMMLHGSSTKYVLEKVHEMAIDLDVMGTAVYFVLSLEDLVLSATSAGHPGLIIVDEDTTNRNFPTLEERELQNPSLGLDVSAPLGEARTKLRPGSIIIAYTDGLHDAGVSPDKKVKDHMFGRGGIARAALDVLDSEPEAIAHHIIDRANAFAIRQGGLCDDASVVVVKLRK